MKTKKIKYSLWVEPGMTPAQTREMFKEVYSVVRKHYNKHRANWYKSKHKSDEIMRKRKKRENKK